MTFSELYTIFDEWYDDVLHVKFWSDNRPSCYMKAYEVDRIFGDLIVLRFSIDTVLLDA